MTKPPLVSVIIVNFNGRRHLERCLESLMQADYENFEVILVDNGSCDGSVEFVEEKYPQIKIKKLEKNYGFAEPNNIGAKIASGEFLLFLNNDTVVTPNFIAELVNTTNQDPQIAICQSMLLKPNGDVDSGGDFVDTLGRAYSSKNRPTDTRYILSARGASMIVRKDVFWKLGGFDESYFASFEDVELGWKAWLWGYKVIVVPKSIVYHLGAKTVEHMSETISFHGIKNNIQLRLTNFDFSDSIKSILSILAMIIVTKLFKTSFAKTYVQLKIPSFRIILKACLWILKNRSQISNKRRILKTRQVVSNKKLREMGLIKTVKNE